jgi:hypothetical protein
MGNALTGSGFHLEGGFKAGHWDFAAEALGNRDTEGHSYMTLYRSHAWWKGNKGWQAGFEQEPLVWGYGLNGGYLLGEAARPVPKLRVESPLIPLHLGKYGLGAWGFQAFLGRLENHRVISSSMQDPAWRRATIAAQGDPQAPMLSGFRIQAEFGRNVEFYANYINTFSGTLKGNGMTEGYGLGDYATSLFGLKDALAEANTDFTDPGHPTPEYKNKARSASNADLGFRVRMPSLERMLGAHDVRLYLSRGSKGVTIVYGLFLKKPLYWICSDAAMDVKHIIQGHVNMYWNEDQRKSVPNLIVPNDTIGILINWPKVRLGVEYQDTSNAVIKGHRSFASTTYVSGFYYYGDPLGEAIGGESRMGTAKLEADISSQLISTSWLLIGDRPFRDNLPDWQLENPGSSPKKDRILGLQQGLTWRPSSIATLRIGTSWMGHGAVNNVPGQKKNGFRWFADLGFRWNQGLVR